MLQIKLRTLGALVVAAALALGAGPALADKPSWAGNGKGKDKSEKSHKAKTNKKGDEGPRARGAYFGDHDRDAVRHYYGDQFRKGKGCPPGLAKKNNGCMPPGQAKKWGYGKPLPKDVVWHELPRELVIKLPTPPLDHRYVRVASDILLIAIGTNMVVDAITDLGSI